MKFLKILFVALVLCMQISCASTDKKDELLRMTPKYDGIHEEFKPYVESFKYRSNGIVTDADMYGVTIGFRDYPEGSNTAGTCWPLPWFREIDISRKWWDRHQSQFEREELLFHELAHCVLYRHHTKPTSSSGFFGWLERLAFKIGIFKRSNGWLADGCPASYMHPYTLSETCIFMHYDYYMEELFQTEETLIEEVEDEIVFFEKKNATQ